MNRFSLVYRKLGFVFVLTAVAAYGVHEDYGGYERYADYGGYYEENDDGNVGYESHGSGHGSGHGGHGGNPGGGHWGGHEGGHGSSHGDVHGVSHESGHNGGHGGNHKGGQGGNKGGHGGHYQTPHYHFSYGVDDPHTKDHKTHHEYRDHDKVVGAYTVKEPDGTHRIVEYTADKHNGFQAVVKRIGHAHHGNGHGGHSGKKGHGGHGHNGHGGHIGHSFVGTTHWGYGSG